MDTTQSALKVRKIGLANLQRLIAGKKPSQFDPDFLHRATECQLRRSFIKHPTQNHPGTNLSAACISIHDAHHELDSKAAKPEFPE